MCNLQHAVITDNYIKLKKNKKYDLLNLIDYIENNSDIYKSKYIKIVDEISLYKINNKSIYNLCKIDDDYNYWFMTKINEKSFYKSKENITYSLKLLAIVDILKSEKVYKVYLSIDNYKFFKSVYQTLKLNNINFSNNNFLQIIIFDFFNFFKKIFNFLILPYYIIKFLVFDINFNNNYNTKNEVTFFSYFTHFDYKKYNNNIFHSNQWGELIDLLREKKIKTNWFHFYIKDSLNYNLKITKLKLNNFNKISSYEDHSFIYTKKKISEYLSIIIKIFFCYIKNIIFFYSKGDVLNKINKHIILKPLIYNDWFDSFFGKTLIENIFHIYNFDIICKKIPQQKLGFYFCENQPWEHALLQSWHKYNHKNLNGVVTSDVRYWDLRYFSYNNYKYEKFQKSILCNNQNSFDLLNTNKISNILIKKIEANRYSKLYNFIKDKKVKDKKLQDINNKLSILFVGDYNDKNNKKIYNLIKNYNLKNNCIFGYKPHPASLFNKNDFKKLNNNIFIEYDEIYKLSLKYNIMVSLHSTNAILDAYVLGYKLLIYLPENELNFSSLRSNIDVIFFKDQIQFEKIVNAININKTIPKSNYFWFNNNYPLWNNIINSR